MGQNKQIKLGGKKIKRGFYPESVQGEYLSSFQQDQKTFLKEMKYDYRKEKSWEKPSMPNLPPEVLKEQVTWP